MNSILVASSDESVTDHIRLVLNTLQVDVLTCQSSSELLKQALENTILAAIIDVTLPGIPIVQTANFLKGIDGYADLPILLLASESELAADLSVCLLPEFTGFLTREHLSESLEQRLRPIIELRRLYDQQQALINRVTHTSQSLSKRALQLNTLAQVIKHITSILDLDALLPTVTSLVRSTFDYYFVGIWMLTDDGKYITLQACHDHTGSSPFPAGFVIEVAQPKSILAQVSRTKEGWLANDVSTDVYYWATDKLPLTRSEIVLPLIVGHNFMGVIDIQSERLNGFDSVDQVLCQALADSTAIAIRNAQLYGHQEKRVQNRTEELENVIKRLEILDREKTNFMQVVSHELLTPLTFVLGFSQVLQDECEHGSTLHQQIMGIKNGAQRMHEIVQNMLDIVQLDVDHIHLSLQPINLHSVVSQAAREFHTAVTERNLDLTYNLSQLPRIEGDIAALTKLFSHLISNAIKYTPDGGHVTVTGRLHPTQKGMVEIVVTDSGIGMEPHTLELIFSKFYRVGDVAHHSSSKTKFKGGGAGLGLAIAQGIVHAHHGRIWAESPGMDEITLPGSSFRLLLPVKQSLN